MNIQVVQNYGQVSRIAAFIIASQIITDPRSILGTASGETAIGVYAELAELYDAGYLDFSKVRMFNLDEFRNLDKSHEQSRYNFIKANLIDRVNIPIANFNIPNGTVPESDVFAECKRYEKLIDSSGGIDVQLLGLGVNGHIGFNEPADFFAPYTYLADLREETRQSNICFFDDIDQVPRQAFSVGIGTIMRARKIVLVAEGYEKAWAIKEMIQKRVTPQVPASILQFHPDATILIDEAAASML